MAQKTPLEFAPYHVLDDFEGERVIQRVTVMGDAPKASAPTRYSRFRDAFSAGSWRDLGLWQFLREGGRGGPGDSKD